jgi:purine-binding chemotaxis protein CheW
MNALLLVVTIAGERVALPAAAVESVVELDGHHYALIVDLVEDVVEALSEPQAVRAAMGDGWERVSQGMVETETGPLLLIDVAALIAGAEAKAA